MNIFKGSIVGTCHRVEAFLGEGGFGCVTKCSNIETGKMVAIKVNKPHPNVVRQTREEIAILNSLQCLDPDICNIVRWNGFFFSRDYICLNFELLDQSLHDFMVDRQHKGLSLQEMSPVIHQLATALSHLRSMSIIHADLKPENIMVMNRQQRSLKVKIIDFGLARNISAVKPGLVLQTIWYRSPEIMLHIPFNEAIDMWSLGLVAVELATGHPLYPGKTDYEMLNLIMQTQGQPEDRMLDRGWRTDYYFHKQPNNQRMWAFKTPEEFSYKTEIYPRETRRFTVNSLDDLEQIMVINNGPQRDQHLLVDLIKRMLHLDQDLRIKPQEVLQHPLYNCNIYQSFNPPHISVDMTDVEDYEPTVTWLPSSIQTSEPGSCLTHRRTRIVTACSPAQEPATTKNEPAKMENNLGEADVQPYTDPGNDSWLRRIFRWITSLFHLLYSGDGKDNR